MPATKTHPALTIHEDRMWLPLWLDKMVSPKDTAGYADEEERLWNQGPILFLEPQKQIWVSVEVGVPVLSFLFSILQSSHMAVPWPLEDMCWRQFMAQWGDCKQSRTAPFSAIVVITIYLSIYLSHNLVDRWGTTWHDNQSSPFLSFFCFSHGVAQSQACPLTDVIFPSFSLMLSLMLWKLDFMPCVWQPRWPSG